MTMERHLEKHFAEQGWLTLLSLQINTAQTINFLFCPGISDSQDIGIYRDTHAESRFAMRKVQAHVLLPGGGRDI